MVTGCGRSSLYRWTQDPSRLAWLAAVYIHQLNRLNFRYGYGHDDSTINIISVLLSWYYIIFTTIIVLINYYHVILHVRRQ